MKKFGFAKAMMEGMCMCAWRMCMTLCALFSVCLPSQKAIFIMQRTDA